jgi:hypothetical protein
LNDKLRVLVRVDLDCGQAEVAAQGHVTAQSIQALYVVVKRANHLKEGLDVVVDVSHAKVDTAALEQLRECSKTHHLPTSIDPFQSECKLRIVAPTAEKPLVAVADARKGTMAGRRLPALATAA